MRVIGPNAFGVVNTAADVRLNASLSPEMPHRGRLGLFTQSGAIGIALLSGLHRRAASGPSTFVSAGNRADVSGNDLLQYWQDDPETDAVLMYLESFGNPRKFTRLARKAAAAKPVVVVKGALHTGGGARRAQRAGRPHPRLDRLRAVPAGRASSASTPSPNSSTRACSWPSSRSRRATGWRSSATPSRSACSPTTPRSPRDCGPPRRAT